MVVALLKSDVEFANGVGRDVQRQHRNVGIEEAIEAATDSIIVSR